MATKIVKTVFRTDDGHEYDTMKEAERHEDIEDVLEHVLSSGKFSVDDATLRMIIEVIADKYRIVPIPPEAPALAV